MVKLGSPRSARKRSHPRGPLVHGLRGALCRTALYSVACVACVALLPIGVARAEPAPIEASVIIGAPARLEAMASRLAGHRFRTGDHVLLLEDVAGAGRPWVGTVASRCGALWLDTAVRSFRLTGPLARLRIAGPGYLVWATGSIESSADGSIEGSIEGATLELQRLGVLARPGELPPPSSPSPSAPSTPRFLAPPCAPGA